MSMLGMNKEPAVFDFNALLPYPEQFKKMDEIAALSHKMGDFTVKDGFNLGGYDWCVENWGTKWNAYQVTSPILKEFEKTKKIKISFQTAWAPPIPVIIKLGRMAEDCKITLRYYERGMAFQGRVVIEEGEITDSSQSEYNGPRGG